MFLFLHGEDEVVGVGKCADSNVFSDWSPDLQAIARFRAA
jgi:hypothetical protein